MSHYKHLTIEEREAILILKTKLFSVRQISAVIGRSPSTVSRELRRNITKDNVYLPSRAEENYKQRRKQCRSPKLLEDECIREKVQYLFLEKQWSPEQISNRLRYENNPISISYTTIYRGIYNGLLEVKKLSHGERGVARKLRHRGKTRHRAGSLETRGKIVISNTLDKRPEEANSRKEIGHWEADTVIGKRNTGCLLTLADRCSRYYLVQRTKTKAAQPVAEKMIELLKQLPSDKVKTVTPDRGKEFANHGQVTKETGIPFYFPDPHAPWQRPTNENTNGLLREYMPKATDFSVYSDDQVQEYAEKLNTRPRKCLGWKTPKEVFFSIELHLT